MKWRRSIKVVGALALFGATALAAALAMAAPDGGPPEAASEVAARAHRAADALADAHPDDRSVLVLAEIAGREADRASGEAASAEATAALETFSDGAEEHLVSGASDPAGARRLLSELVRQLRGGGPTPPPPSPAVPSPPLPPAPPPTPVEAQAEPSEATVVGRDLTIEADQVVSEASVVGGNLTVRGHVLGDAVAVGGTVHLEPTARVDGDVVSVGGQVVRDPGATVLGDQTQVGPAALTRMLPMASSSSGSSHAAPLAGGVGKVVQAVGSALVMALVGLVILALAPSRTKAIMMTIRKRPGMSLLAGLLACVICAVASLLMAVTIVLIPLIPFVLLALAVALLLGMTAASHVVGEAMPGKRRASRSSFVCLILGIAILGIVSLLPFGSFVVALVGCIALGAVIISKVGAVTPGG